MIIQPSRKSPQVSTSADGLMSSIDKVKLNSTNVAYGTCATAASTAAKVVKITGNENWDLFPGSIIIVKFSYTNVASNPTLNVNGKGAMPIIYNTSNISTSNLTYAGSANRYITYVYTGSAFVFIGWSIDNNTTYSDMTGATTDSAGNSGLVPAPAAGDQDKFLKADGTWGTPTDTKYGEATTSKSGLMSAADKSKLDAIDVMTGATTESAGKSGFVPAPNIEDCEKFLKGDGTWSKLPDFSAGKDDNSLSYINGGI